MIYRFREKLKKLWNAKIGYKDINVYKKYKYVFNHNFFYRKICQLDYQVYFSTLLKATKINNSNLANLDNFFFRFDSGKFATAASSNFEHDHTTFGKLKEGLIVVSGQFSGPEVELFVKEEWIRLPDFTLSRFRAYSTATIDNKLYVFGKQKNRLLIIVNILVIFNKVVAIF